MAQEVSTESYRWPAGELVQRVDIRAQPNGRVLAYLYADASEASFPARLQLRAALHAHGLATLPDCHDGTDALRISGLHDAGQLLAILRIGGFTKTDPSPASGEAAAAEPAASGTLQHIRTNSLQASGIVYTVGNVIYFLNGIFRNRERKARGLQPEGGQIGAALSWGVGDLLMALIGKRDESRQFTQLLTGLQEQYARDGIAVANDNALPVEARHSTTLGTRVYDFAQAHLNQLKCATEVVAAVNYYKAGAKQNNKWKQRTGIIFGTGFLASLLIPEKKIDPEAYAQAGALGKLAMRIQANPLAIGGISGYSNTVFTSIGAYKERKHYREYQNNPQNFAATPIEKLPSKYYGFDFAAPAVMFFGNSLYAISKKGGGIHNSGVINDVYAVAAQIINRQPANKQAAAIASTVDFLSRRLEIPDARPQVELKLREQLDIQRRSPWRDSLPRPANDAPLAHPANDTAPGHQPGAIAPPLSPATVGHGPASAEPAANSNRPRATIQAHGRAHTAIDAPIAATTRR